MNRWRASGMLAMFCFLTLAVVHRFHFTVHLNMLFMFYKFFLCVIFKNKYLQKNNNKIYAKAPPNSFNTHNSIIIVPDFFLKNPIKWLKRCFYFVFHESFSFQILLNKFYLSIRWQALLQAFRITSVKEN